MFSLICVSINGSVNNLWAGDYRRYCAHYDVTVMGSSIVLVGPLTRKVGYWTKIEKSLMDWRLNTFQRCGEICTRLTTCVSRG